MTKATQEITGPYLCCQFSTKILEKLMCNRLCNFPHQNNIFYEFQFGFRKQHSTVLALMEAMDSIYSHLDNHDFILGIFLDL